MKRYIKFSKMTALGNDFIIINDTNGYLKDLFTQEIIKNLCMFNFGIGANGLILIEPDDQSLFKMVYYNADGLEAPMCGNGARASAYFAKRENIVGNTGKFRASDGFHSFEIKNNLIRISLNVDTKSIVFDKFVGEYQVSFINTGVPHAITIIENIDDSPVNKIGKIIRRDKSYSKEGVNVDFIQIIDEHNIKIRTFERGIEAETYSCGTGATAAAIVSTLKSFTKPPINVINSLGRVLKIDGVMKDYKVREISLEGEAKEVAEGYFDIYEY